MQKGKKQPLGHTAYELVHICGGKLQEKSENTPYSNCFTVGEIPYNKQKEEMRKK